MAIEKFFAYIQIAEGEIGGLGEVVDRTSILDVRDIILLPQTTTGEETTLDQAALKKLMVDEMKDGRDFGRYRVWWHSHGIYKVGWSVDKDESTIKRLSRSKYLVSIVGNKHNDVATRYDIQTPEVFTLHGLPLQIYHTFGEKPVSMEDLKAEVAEKVVYKKEVSNGKNR